VLDGREPPKRSWIAARLVEKLPTISFRLEADGSPHASAAGNR
jgi:hypothetical protein